MKKLFIIGLSLLLVIFGFTSSNLVESKDIKEYRYMARGIGANSPYIDFTEIFEDDEFTKVVVNTVSDGEKVYDVYMVAQYGSSDTNFWEFTDFQDIKHHYAWQDGCCWYIDTTDFNYFFPTEQGNEAQIIGIEFGNCNCLCSEKTHFVVNFKTTMPNTNGKDRYAGIAYITSVTPLE